MTQKDIRALLEQGYDRERWKKLVTALFPGRDVFAQAVAHEPETQEDRKHVQRIYQFGEVRLKDGEYIGLFEVHLLPSVDLTRNRASVRRSVERLAKHGGLSGALITFLDPRKAIWRFSFYRNTLSPEGGWETNPNSRYTYLLGEGEKCRTAAEQFEVLANKAGQVTLKDLLDAFSVEKVSKAFFREYKEHYQDFVQHLTGKRMVKKSGKWEEKEMHAPSPKLAAYFNGNEKDARDFCKKLMGRLVFLYFLQKKRWLGATGTDYTDGELDFVYRLYRAQGNDAFYPNVLVPLFFETLNAERTGDAYRMPDGGQRKVPFLNGGLFDMDVLDRKTRLLTFPPELFSNPAKADEEKERGFLDFLNAYNFTVHEAGPEEQTLAVDPEMLGHIFENLLEDNKDKGAFYTPKEIVHYMCQESLVQYLKNYLVRHGVAVTPDEDPETHKSLEDRLRRFLKDGTAAELSRYSGLLLKALHDVKVCDPAIGSGAFPMGILHEVFQAVYHLQEFSPDEFSSTWGIEEWQPAEVKLRIIQHSIYGVDIERGAVDIARLRFWLSIIVDERTPRTLPNLDYKIVVGNSLVGMLNGEILRIDWDKTGASDRAQLMRRLIDSLHEKTELFFRDQSQQKKGTLASEIRNLKVDLLSKQVELNRDKYREQMLPTNKIGGLSRTEKIRAANERIQLAAFEQTLGQLRTLAKDKAKPLNYFDWQLDFPEILNPVVTKGPGFDIVIGNPPYVKEYTNRAAFDGLHDSPYYKGKMDLWYLFACRCLDLVKQDQGVLTFIATNNWTTNSGASLLRDKLTRDATIGHLVDFGSYMIFESAGIQTMILTCLRNSSTPTYTFSLSRVVARNPTFPDVVDALHYKATDCVEVLQPTIRRDVLLGALYTFSDGDKAEVLDSIAANGRGRLTASEIAQGIVAPQDRVNGEALEKLSNDCVLGEGIFVLSNVEKEGLGLNAAERSIMKPYFTSAQLSRFTASQLNTEWVIYTDSGYSDPRKMQGLPNLKKHLDRFTKVITSSNAPYGLHRSRDSSFFVGPRVLALRKSVYPTFTYVQFEGYVSQSYNIIKSVRFQAAYLTALFNSSLGAFWFRNKGKMQGHNYQLDLEPLLGFPICVANRAVENALTTLVERRCQTSTGPEATALEAEIDVLVCKLYGLSWEQAKVVDPQLALSKEAYDAVELPEAEGPSGNVVSEPGVTGLTDEGTLFGQKLDEPPPKRATSRAPESAPSNGQASGAILKFLRANSGWHGKSAILEGSGVSADAWNPTIKQLLDEGKVERQGEKKGARYRVL